MVLSWQNFLSQCLSPSDLAQRFLVVAHVVGLRRERAQNLYNLRLALVSNKS